MSGLPSTYFKSVTYGNGKFVCVSDNSKGGIYYSTDAKTWKAVSEMAGITFSSIIYANGKFVAVRSGSGAYYSEDGLTWVQISTFPSGTFRDIAYSIDGGYDNS
jgi:hypothetical protein